MTGRTTRVAAGVPTGGQFATAGRAEATVTLAPPAPAAQPAAPSTVDPGPPPTHDWARQVSPYTGLVSYERTFTVQDGTATHQVSGTVPGEEPRPDGAATVLGSGGITIAQGDKIPGEIHYKILDAPLVDAEGNLTGERRKAVYVNWVEVGRGTMPNKGKGWASAMYAAIRDAHPDCVIPAAANLEAPGKRLVKRYRDAHPVQHRGRFDDANRIHPTTGSADPMYRVTHLAAPDSAFLPEHLED